MRVLNHSLIRYLISFGHIPLSYNYYSAVGPPPILSHIGCKSGSAPLQPRFQRFGCGGKERGFYFLTLREFPDTPGTHIHVQMQHLISDILCIKDIKRCILHDRSPLKKKKMLKKKNESSLNENHKESSDSMSPYNILIFISKCIVTLLSCQ